nr:MAG TPA: hypothetical protein [Caudoviricetes sp.]
MLDFYNAHPIALMFFLLISALFTLVIRRK